MTCYFPLEGWRSAKPNKNGKHPPVFKRTEGQWDKPVNVPCGRCIGCRLERSRQWAIRCMHETKMHKKNIFITLTYRPEDLPEDGSLNHEHFQLFMKKLRAKYMPKCPFLDDEEHKQQRIDWFDEHEIRYYMCGEYGSQFGRPHYHAILFNFDFDDKKHWRNSKGGEKQYRSPSLEKLWPYGASEIGTANFNSAGYIARYIMKKKLGKDADAHYFDASTNIYRKPEYTCMSRKSGIGKKWLEKFTDDVYPSDEIIVKGRSMRPPKYYDGQFELASPGEMKQVKAKRKRDARKRLDDNTSSRHYVKLQVQTAKLKQLKRTLD